MSRISTVKPYLERWFTDHRLLFWHDPEGQYESELDSLDLSNVTLVCVANDEFAIKNRLLTAQEKKFLVYRSGLVPSGIGNWFLDLELAHGVFTADRSSLVAKDLGLTASGVDEAVQAHEKFFNASKRVDGLKALLAADDDATRLRSKMCAVLLGQKEHSLLEIARTLLVENANDQRTKFDALVDFGLDGFFWQGVASIYGYESPHPSVDDFVLWVFREAMGGFESERLGGLRNIQLDFASFRNDRRSQKELGKLAIRAARDLNYKASIEGKSFRDLVSFDLFKETDQRIISDLARAITEQTVSARDVADVVRARQSSVWIDSYRPLYVALGAASELLHALGTIELSFSSFDEALESYRTDLYRIDQLYRQFTHARRTFEGDSPLGPLRDLVEKIYTNKFVYELGNAFQKQIDSIDRWASSTVPLQSSFFDTFIKKIIEDDKKAVVIISDALRYEVADELASQIRQEDRFDADLEAALGVLPSYTALGMAALLPHSSLRHAADGKSVLADDQPTHNTLLRARILETVGGTAIQAEDFKALTADDRRDLFRRNKVLYVYHNRIDATGDKAATERQVFEAADDTIRDIIDLTKKAANANATNIYVTADHGFLYQDEALPDQFYLSESPQGDNILVTNRRYVLGTGLKLTDAFTTFTSALLNLDSNIEVQIPKSIHRLRLAGGGSRFVHGGATLQEVVVPVLAINKKRKSDTRLVNVKVLPDTDKITTGQLVVKLFQSEPVTDKVQARVLRAGLYVGETLISSSPPTEVLFDSVSAEQRDRYQSIQLLLNNDANDFNNRPVEFRLEERIPNTNHWRIYEKVIYTLKRSFTSDFDF